MTSGRVLSPLRTLTGQITALVVLAALVGAVLTGGLLFWLAYHQKTGQTTGMMPELDAASEAARVATIVREAKTIASPAGVRAFLADAEAPHEHIRLTDLSEASSVAGRAREAVELQRIRAELSLNWHIQTFFSRKPGVIVVPLDQRRALAFVITKGQVAQLFILAQSGLAASIIFLLVIFLSTYAIYRVTRPLAAFAVAAESFGRSAQEGETLPATGPLEVARVASALNDMRNRVRRLVDERTRMLAAISHDLRTPLTRLRLRSERIPEAEGRDALLDDIDTIEAMVAATLSYLRDGRLTEAPQLMDLPSFLQTACDEYGDTGHDVTYQGPARLDFACRPVGLKRALSNIVDNGLRFGTQVTIALAGQAEGGVIIDVTDDGPGIPVELHEKVFEPYFKADQARSADGKSFGLGLAIAREIIVRDGGDIHLSHNLPTGLVVSLRLKPAELPGTPSSRNIS